jgi:hypothetical protein
MMVYRSKFKLAGIVALLLALLIGCSPEAQRARGDGYGTGADPGNHSRTEPIQPCSKVFNDRCDP